MLVRKGGELLRLKEAHQWLQQLTEGLLWQTLLVPLSKSQVVVYQQSEVVGIASKAAAAQGSMGTI
jgi:hypothetical protein